MIEDHVRYAGGQGFATNIGGLVTAVVAIPANITSLALIQCRLVASIAHLRGYDLADQRVRNAILACVLGEDTVKSLVAQAQAAQHPDGHRDRARPTTRTSTPSSPPRSPPSCSPRSPGSASRRPWARRVPVVGGLFGASADAYSTWQVGRYADRELLPRTLR